MRYITCKAQWLSRPLTTKTGMSGFEGPAAKTEIDDGHGVPMLKGMVTSSFMCFFEETGRSPEGNILYDGTINIPDTRANRYKIAQHVRARDLRVKDRNLEREILAENPRVPRAQRPRPVQHFVDMPEDFDGSKVILRSGTQAIVDADPIEDVHAQVQDAEFTEVAPIGTPAVGSALAADQAIAAEADLPKAVEPVRKTSAAEVMAGAVAAPNTIDPKAAKAKTKPAEPAKAEA